ncbi:Bug family tripartite tricarboxylate transporter substrate binding protein [Pseudorhodoferax sp.]|uniref:Bug family tripartite tricarboxylate transporter substrate binding protein n=1 Tax=Pseudorhodoferax sp. TaxID=1993553 RepID=UPI002DD63691|nr:tripartite tricarboxylate transporter substrate binding protein [Pseudorhodoferax sp.]
MRKPSPHPTRRGVLALGASVLAAPALAQASWPNKPVRFVVAFPPGGLADVLIRMLAPQLGEALGQPVVIDNRGGAGGNVAAVETARNGADGHTFMVNVTTLESVNPIMFEKMPVDPGQELQHVALLANTQLFLATRPTLPPNTVAEFVAYAKANPGKLSFGSAGNGTTPHVGGELFKQTAGFFATHIPYRGMAPAIQDVMAGQIDYALVPGTVFPSVKAGKLKLLAVASPRRPSYYTAAPTIEEAGFGKVYVDTPFAVYAPAAMPAANVARMNRELNKLLVQPAVKARFADVGAEPLALSPAELTAMVKDEIALFGPIVRARGIKAD